MSDRDANQDADGRRPLFYEDLLRLSRAAHAARQHEVAYHALAAALHAADDGGDVHALAEVIREAEAQIGRIDRETPEHRLSTTSAGRHEHAGVYAMLVRQAHAHVAMHSHRPSAGAALGPQPSADGG